MGEVKSVRAIHYNKPDKKKFEAADIQKMRRERLKVCTGRDKITLEIYGHDSDEPLKTLLWRISASILATRTAQM